VTRERIELRWDKDGLSLVALEPDDALVAAHAATLTRWYTAPENASMMGGSTTMTEADTREYWTELREAGGRGFLFFADGVLVGDADLRGFRDDVAEFAIMIGEASQKGRGLGLALARMLHVFAFRELRLRRLYVPPKAENARVHRLNAALGYQPDDGPVARSFADEEDARTASVGPEEFRAKNDAAWREVVARRV